MQAGRFGLPALLRAVRAQQVSFEASDLYRLCALLKGEEDVLGMRSDNHLMASLAAQYAKMDKATLTPFQGILFDQVLVHARTQSGRADSSQGLPLATTPSAMSSSSAGEPTALERLGAIWEVVTDVQQADGSMSLSQQQAVESHVRALEKQLRQLQPYEVNSLIKSLSVINYRHYQHISLLSRVGCEVAPQLSHTDICRLYFNLHKLGTQDSLQAIVNIIIAHMAQLSATEVFLIAQALERQEHTSPASTRLTGALAPHAVKCLPEVDSPAYHRSMLVAMSRYNMRGHPAQVAILEDLSRHQDRLQEHDLLPILRATLDMDIASSANCYCVLLERIEQQIPTMHVRYLDGLMDTLSMVPADTTAAMKRLLDRLETDAGMLAIPQLRSILEMLSSYPPARGHVCIVSLGFAGALRAEFIDGQALESMVVSLAQLKHLTDDFYALANTLQKEKGGIRKFSNLQMILECYTADTARDERARTLISGAIFSLAPALRDQEVKICQQALLRLQLEDRQLQQRLSARAAPMLQKRGTKPRRKLYDPMEDLLL